ncbi:MAG TPA: FecR domain-containing protein [Acidobacteriota bacterium]|nr:FecR domain-containing protein [Acidobacteriota bacterium]
MKSSVLRFVFVGLFAIGLTLHAFAQQGSAAPLPTKAGAIKIGKVEGTVLRVTADSRSTPLKVGDTVIETDSVKTEKGALVVLVFANGASVKLGSETLLRIEEFKMDPLEEDVVVSKLDSEPSISTTKLDLAFGEMVGDVKHLNRDKGSSFKISTPVGAAGIRGTTFRIVFRPTGDGKSFTFQLSTADGRVAFEGTVQAREVEVPTNQEIVVTAEATVDATTGQVDVTSVNIPATTQPISSEATQAITTAVVNAITEAAKNTTITTNEQQQSANTETGTSGNNSNNSGTGNTGTGGDNNSNSNNSNSNNSDNSNSGTPSGNANPPDNNVPVVNQPRRTTGAGG